MPRLRRYGAKNNAVRPGAAATHAEYTLFSLEWRLVIKVDLHFHFGLRFYEMELLGLDNDRLRRVDDLLVSRFFDTIEKRTFDDSKHPPYIRFGAMRAAQRRWQSVIRKYRG